MRITASTLVGDHGWDRVVPETGPDVASRRYVQVAIVDCGNGIQRDDLRRLFVGFQQLDGSSTRRHGGTGIGLALSARLAAAMQGHIAVRTRPAPARPSPSYSPPPRTPQPKRTPPPTPPAPPRTAELSRPSRCW
jgi:signal transduction histidine kinase